MKNAIKIGIDARPLSYQLTGIGVYLKCLLQEIQEIDNRNFYYLISNAPIDMRLKNKKWSKIEGNIKRKLVSTAWMQVNAPVIAYRNKIDLFWGPRHHLPVLLPPNVKTVVTIHDTVHRLYPDTMALPNLLVERLLMRHSVHRSDAVITDAKSIAHDVSEIYKLDKRKVHTIYPGIPPLKNGSAVCSNKILPIPYFLFVGTLEPRKNFDRIFKAFEKIKPESYDVNLVIAGRTGWKNKDFLAMLDDHPIKSRIYLTGYVSRDQLAEYYGNALCLLYPSLYEGFGFPIVEAMSCGTPVITGNTSSMPEIANEAAIIVDPLNIPDIANAMVNVLTDTTLRDRLIESGKKRARHFSWQDSANRFCQIFESIVKHESTSDL